MQENNKKKIRNIIMIGVLSILLIVLIIIGMLIYNKKKDDKNAVNTPNILTKAEAIDFYYNNYLISYLLEGDIKLGEGTTTDVDTNEVWYAVNDEKINHITSITQITQMIEKTLRPQSATDTLEKFHEKKYNNYISVKGQLYVQKTENVCTYNMPDIKKEDIIWQKASNNEIILSYGEYGDAIYYHESDGKWYMPFLIYGCDYKKPTE